LSIKGSSVILRFYSFLIYYAYGNIY